MLRGHCDVLILGAGAAGLVAAAELAQSHRSVLVLEARERVGGRIWSHREPGLPLPVELGAEFIHGRARATFALLEKAGSAAVDAPREHWSLREGRLEPSKRLFSEIRDALAATDAVEKRDLSFEVLLERHLRPMLSEDAREFARTLAEGYDAADVTRASARAIAQEWAGASSAEVPQFRPQDGYGRLLDALLAQLHGSRVRLRLQSIVHEVRWKRGSVEARGAFLGQPFRVAAARAIVTLPLGVLKLAPREPGAVRFTPALTEKRDALKRLASGPVVKALLRFRTAFWEELDDGRYSNAAFFHAPHAAFPTFWTALPLRIPLIAAWTAGPKATRLSGAAKPELVRCALESLASIFGKRAQVENTLEGAWVHDWQCDAFARGAYSYVTVGGEHARERLAEPLLDTLFFAGEAADFEGEAGTVAGALQSGLRAARALLAAR